MFCINAHLAHPQIKHYALDIRLYFSQIVGSEIRHCLPRLAFKKKKIIGHNAKKISKHFNAFNY